ncbi:MAG: GNAT family N-acetyltransferase [Anaerolineales bacterium]
MASLTSALASSHIRPFRAWRDGLAVSRLLELCFDIEGKSRRSHPFSLEAAMQQLGRWAQGPFLPGGYIWEEDGKVVGNVSLIRLYYRGRAIMLIANVAVHPDFRRRGIARALMEQAIKSAKEQQVGEIWLQVRAENEGAIVLYSQLGFTIQAQRTVWYATTTPQIPNAYTFEVRPLPRDFWHLVRHWLERLHPHPLGWYHRWDWEQARPGWEMSLWRWILGIQAFQWISMGGAKPQAALIWFPSPRGEIGLWLAYPPNAPPQAIIPLLWVARRHLYHSHRGIYLEHPDGEMADALLDAGFSAVRTLLWMSLQ